MISLNMKVHLGEQGSYDEDQAIAILMSRFRALPGWIAKKHLKAVMRRAMKPGVPLLRANTPPTGIRRGRRRKGEKARSSGDLRRAATANAGITGKNSDFDQFAWATLGYRYGFQSRKAIWLEFGTSNGVRAFKMMERTLQQFGNPAASPIAVGLAQSLEMAATEAATWRTGKRLRGG